MYIHSENRNLTIIEDNIFEGLSLTRPRGKYYYPFIKQYLESNKRVMDDALSIHPRTFVIRVDLRFPSNYRDPDYPRGISKSEITRFIESFKNKVNSEIDKRRREGKRAHSCSVSYIWVLEYGENSSEHYHIVLFLNGNSFRRPGSKTTPNRSSPLVNMIVEAWESALNISFEQAWGLVNIPRNSSYSLKRATSPEQDNEYRKLFERLSYLTKLKTKVYGRGERNSYGCSRRRR